MTITLQQSAKGQGWIERERNLAKDPIPSPFSVPAPQGMRQQRKGGVVWLSDHASFSGEQEQVPNWTMCDGHHHLFLHHAWPAGQSSKGSKASVIHFYTIILSKQKSERPSTIIITIQSWVNNSVDCFIYKNTGKTASARLSHLKKASKLVGSSLTGPKRTFRDFSDCRSS